MLNWQIDTKRKGCEHNADLQNNLQLDVRLENWSSAGHYCLTYRDILSNDGLGFGGAT